MAFSVIDSNILLLSGGTNTEIKLQGILERITFVTAIILCFKNIFFLILTGGELKLIQKN